MLTGGAGQDLFHFGTGTEGDRFTDFKPGRGDAPVLSIPGATTVDDLKCPIGEVGGGTLIERDNGLPRVVERGAPDRIHWAKVVFDPPPAGLHRGKRIMEPARPRPGDLVLTAERGKQPLLRLAAHKRAGGRVACAGPGLSPAGHRGRPPIWGP